MQTFENGLGISTQLTPDCGYETALLDKNGTYPVERYATQEESVQGHQRWIEFAKTNQNEITKLGWVINNVSLVPDEKVVLERAHGYKFENQP